MAKKPLTQTYQYMYRRLNAFICILLSCRLKHFGEKSPGDALVFRRIFSKKKQYYDCSMIGYDIESDFKKDLDDNRINERYVPWNNAEILNPWRGVSHNKSVNPLNSKAFIFNVYCLFNLGGFEILKDLFANKLTLQDYVFARRIQKAIININECVTNEQYKLTILPVCIEAIKFGERMIEEWDITKIKHQDIEKNIFSMNKMINPQVQEADYLVDLVLKIHLNFALKLLKTESQDLRNDGFIEILKIVKGLNNKWPLGDAAQSTQNRSKMIAEWLGAHNVFNLMFGGKNCSIKTIKECTERDLIGFMYSWGVIKADEIQHMWKTILNGGDSEVHIQILKCFEMAFTHLNSTDATILLTKIQEIPLSTLNNTLVDLLVILAKNELYRWWKNTKKGDLKRSEEEMVLIKRKSEPMTSPQFASSKARNEEDPFVHLEPINEMEEHHFKVLEWIFSLTSEDTLINGLSSEMQQLLIEEFLKLLSIYGARLKNDPRPEFAVKCEKMLEKDKSLSQASTIYSSIINQLIKEGANVQVATPNLVQILVFNLLKLKFEVASKVTAIRSDVNNKLSQSEVLETLVTNPTFKLYYYKDVVQRLKVLQLVLVSGLYQVKLESFNVLCEIFVKMNFSEKDKDLFFGLMKDVTSSPVCGNLLASGSFDCLLYDILLRIDPQIYSELQYQCLSNILLAANVKHGFLKNNNEGFEVLKKNLIGLQSFWDIALKAKNPVVQKQAADQLFFVYSHLNASLIEKEGSAIREEFIKQIMKQIDIEYSEIEKNPRAQPTIIHHAVDLLAHYFVEYENVENIESNIFDTDDYTIYAIFSLGFSGKYTSTYKIYKDMTIADIINTISNKCPYVLSVFQLRIIAKGDVLQPSSNPLSSLFGKDKNLEILVEKIADEQEGGNLDSLSSRALRFALPDLSETIRNLALVQAQGDQDIAFSLLTEPNTLAKLKSEAEDISSRKTANIYKMYCQPISDILIKNETYFKVLYKCLNINDQNLTDKVWTLLNKMPISAKMHNEMLAMPNNPQFPQMFSEDSQFKLSYSLKVFAVILSRQLKNGEKLKITPSEWLSSFIKSGGIEYLCSLLFKFSIKILEEIPAGTLYNSYISSIDILVKITKGLAMHAFLEVPESPVLEYIRMSEGSTPQKKAVGPNQFNISIEFNGDLPLLIRTKLKDFQIQDQKTTSILVKLIQSVCEIKEIKMNCLDLVEEACRLLGALLSFNYEEQEDFFSGAFADFFKSFLRDGHNSTLKKVVRKYVKIIFDVYNKAVATKGSQRTDIALLYLMLGFIPQPDQNCPNCSDFFEFLIELLPMYKDPECQVNYIFPSSTLAELLIDYIYKRIDYVLPTGERQDKQLACFMQLFTQLIKVKPDCFKECSEKNLEELILMTSKICNSLYKSSENNTRKCAGKINLKPSLALLLELSNVSTKCKDELFKNLRIFHKDQIKNGIKDLSYENSQMDDTRSNYVGLYNFGATCYVNSILQIFYMIPEFRHKILSMPFDQIKQNDCERVTANLQQIFSYLFYSNQQYYIPSQFIREFLWEGAPINVTRQRDAPEFYEKLIDKLEAELKGTNNANLIRQLLGSTVVQEVESLDEINKYENGVEEVWNIIQLDIKGKSDLKTALDSFISRTILDGADKLRLQDKNVAVKASKRFFFKTLSPTLFFQLKRFEYNFNSFEERVRKVNDYFTFPMKLNLFNWTKAYLKQEPCDTMHDFDYQLVGVVVHTGIAEAGHYFSLIMDREIGSPHYGKWFEFNDRIVGSFDISKMDERCFGTKSGNNANSSIDDLTSAYILVYEKVTGKEKAANLDIQIPEIHKAKIIQDNLLYTNAIICCNAFYIDFFNNYLKLAKPDTIASLTTEYYLFDEEIDDIGTKYAEKSPSLPMLSLSLLFASECISKTKETKKYGENMLILASHLKENKLFALMIILHFIKHYNIMFNLLLESSSDEVKKETYRLISQALFIVFKEEQKEKPATLKFIQVFLNEGIDYAKTKEIKADYIFALLKDYISEVDIGVKQLIEMGCIGKILNYLSQARKGKDSVRFSEPTQFLYNLLSRCVTNDMHKLKSVPEGFPAFKENAIIIPLIEINLFFSKWSLTELVTHNQKALSSILVFLSWENRDRSLIIIQDMVKCFFDLRGSQNCNQALRVLRDICSIQDSLSEERTNLTLFKTGFEMFDSIVDYISEKKNSNEDLALDFLNMVAELLNIQKVKDVIVKNYLKEFVWVPKFLNQNPGDLKVFSFNIWTNSEASKKRDFIKKQFALIQEIDNRKEVIEIMEEDHKVCNTQAGDGNNSNNNNKAENIQKEEKKEISAPKEDKKVEEQILINEIKDAIWGKEIKKQY